MRETVVPGPRTTLARPRAAAGGPRPTPLGRVARVGVGGLFRLVFRIRVEGLAGIPAGPCVYCANHLGWADPFLLLLCLPETPRLVVLGRHPREVSAFRAWVVDTLGVLLELDLARPVGALARATGAVAAGHSLIIFPEGTYQGAREGRLQPLQPGAAYIAAATDAPLVPVGLTGTRELWLRRPLTIRVGPPLVPPAGSGRRRTQAATLTAALGPALLRLLPGDRAGATARVRPLRRWLSTLFD